MTDTALPKAAAGRRTAQTPRFAEKQAAIVAAATELMLDRGLKGFTLADIAEKTGLIKQGVAYYFSRRDDVAAACIERTAERVDAITLEALRGETAAERVGGFLRGYLALSGRIAAGDEPQMAPFDELRVLNEATYQRVLSRIALMFRHIRALFDTPEQAWMDRRTRIARGHLLLMIALATRGLEWSRRPEDYARTGERMVDVTLNGLAAPGCAFQPPKLALASLTDASPREAFLRAATRLINEQGYRGASVEKIASQLKVSKGAFYHHNDAKDDVVIRCFERTIALTTEIQLSAAAAPYDGLTRLAAAARAMTELQVSEEGPLIRTTALYALPAAAETAIHSQWSRLVRRFNGMVCDGIADGTIRPVDTAVAGGLVMSAVNASAELPGWSRDIATDDLTEIYIRPLFTGILSP